MSLTALCLVNRPGARFTHKRVKAIGVNGAATMTRLRHTRGGGQLQVQTIATRTVSLADLRLDK